MSDLSSLKMWLVYHQAFHRNQILTWSEIQPAPWHLKLTLSDPCQFQQKEQWLNMYPQTNLHLRYYRSSWWVCSDDMAKTFADWNLPFITDWRVLKSVPEEEVSWSHSFDASIADESLSVPFIFTIFYHSVKISQIAIILFNALLCCCAWIL